jgi:hypothetical protein
MTRLSSLIVPSLADVVGFGLTLLLLPWLRIRFQELGFMNTVIVGAAFLLFCLGVYALKRLEPDSDGISLAWLGRRGWSILGVFFALFMMLATAYVAGFLDSLAGLNRQLLDEPSITIYLLLTPASWFGLALIYMLLLSADIETTVTANTGRYVAYAFAGLASVNLMAAVCTAILRAVADRFETVGSGVFVWGLALTLLLLLFGPPRLLYRAKQAHWGSLITFVPYLGYLAWLVLPDTNLYGLPGI